MERIMNEGFEPEDLERMNKADGDEDILLAEIDAFRSKAFQLQQLINAKETKAAELEEMVREKEAVNVRLQDELSKKKEEANAIVTDVENQVDKMLDALKESMNNLEYAVKSQVEANQESSEAAKSELDETLKNLTSELDALQAGLSEKTHSESVHLFRLLQDTLKETDRSNEIIGRTVAEFKTVKTFCTVITIITGLGLIASVASLLLALGII